MRELRSNQAKFSLAIVAVASAGILVFAANHQAPPSRETSDPMYRGQASTSHKPFGTKIDPTGKSPRSSADGRFSFFAEKGTETTFNFMRTLKASIDGKPLLDLGYSGKLVLTTLGESSPQVFSFEGTFEFTPESLKQFPPELAALNEKEKSLVRFKIGADGKMSDLKSALFTGSSKSPDEASLREQKNRILLDLVSEIAFLNFEDVNGKYSAELSERKEDTVYKTKVAYSGNSGDETTRPVIKSSKIEVKWDGAAFNFSRLRLLTLDESLESGNENFRLTQHSRLKLTLVLHRIGVNSTLGLSEKIHYHWKETSLNALASRAPASENFKRPTENWDMLSGKLSILGNLTPSEKLKTFHELVRTMSAENEIVQKLRALLLKNQNNPDLFKLGIGALASVSGEAAQSALREIYQTTSNENKSARKTMILTALTTTEAPLTPETQNFLKTLATNKTTENPLEDDSIRISATYALGSSLQKETSPVTKSDTEKTLGDLLAQANSIEEKKTYIDAIGNSGDPHFIPALADFINSSDTSLREKATFSLRFMPTTFTESFLLNALGDPEAKVRRSALQAIRTQKNAGRNIEPFAEKIRRCIKSESSSELRSQCLELGS